MTDLHCDCPVFTLGFYEGTLASAIKTGKYRPSRKLFRHLARLAGERVGKPWPGTRPEVVIPVPLHSSREESRGFNQAAMVGRELAKAVGAHFSPALCRTRATRPQAGCDELERASNLHGAFSLAPGLAPRAFKGRRLCLVDDVATTGATLEECRKALFPLNPAAISVLTLAHAPRRIPVEGK